VLLALAAGSKIPRMGPLFGMIEAGEMLQIARFAPCLEDARLCGVRDNNPASCGQHSMLLVLLETFLETHDHPIAPAVLLTSDSPQFNRGSA
jgi:hypothetical protein